MSFSSTYTGSLFPDFGLIMPVMGDFLSEPVRNWYLKKDFKEDIFRFIDFEVIFCSFRLASQERINEVVTSGRGVSPKLESR
jgi:hypothetical protein